MSGASALAFEVVLHRALVLTFGAQSRAAAVTLAAYMAGLALGGPIGARLAARTTRPARLYATLEALAAMLFVATVAVQPGVRAVYAALGGGIGPMTLGGIRLVLAFASLLPATVVSAAAFPLAVSAIDDAIDDAPGRPAASASLAAWNVAGAAAGAALAAFLGIRLLGVGGASLAAGVLGGVAALVASSMPAPVAPRQGEPIGRRPSRPLLGAAAASGFVTIALEVVLLRVAAVHTTAGVYAFGLVLCAALGGLAIGGRVAARRIAADPQAAGRVLSLSLRLGGAIGLGAVLAAPLLSRAVVGDVQGLFEASAAGLFLREAALAALLLGPPFFWQGMCFPSAVAAAGGGAGAAGSLLFANLAGAAAGALVTGFVTLPLAGLRGAAAAAAFVGIAGALGMVPVGEARRARAIGLLAAACLAAAVIPVRQLKERGGDRVVFYREGTDAVVTVREGRGGRVLRVDGQTVASSFGAGVTDARMLAHLPLLLLERPRRALTVGWGSGGTSLAMTLHGVHVDCAEIEPAVFETADLFDEVNGDVRRDRRFRMIVEDARDVLVRARPRERWDVVASDCTNLQWGHNGTLYSVEYWRLVKSRLAAGGIAVAWMPLGGLRQEDLRTLVASFARVFPHATIHYFTNAVTNFFLLVGAPERLGIDVDDVRRRIRERRLWEDLSAVGLADPYRIAASLLVGERGVRGLARGARLHTDGFPRLDYRAPYLLFQPTAGPRLGDLLEVVAGAETQLVGGEALERARHVIAAQAIARGNVEMLAGRAIAAARRYRQAAALIPDDPAIPVLLEEAGAR